MSGSSNFLQFNTAKANMLADADYAANAVRTGGVTSGIAAKALYNKLFYQASTFIAAFASVIAGAGYAVSDSDIENLAEVIAAYFGSFKNAVINNSEVVSIVRGTVAADGTVLLGSGFTVNKTGAGNYTITFTNHFVSVPTIIVTSEAAYDGYGQYLNTGAKEYYPNKSNVSTNILTGSITSNGDHEFLIAGDVAFSFIAIG